MIYIHKVDSFEKICTYAGKEGNVTLQRERRVSVISLDSAFGESIVQFSPSSVLNLLERREKKEQYREKPPESRDKESC